MSNRYDKALAGPLTHGSTGWVPAENTPRVIRIDAPPGDLADVSGVWTPVASGSRDSTSAEDRAWALLWRTLPAYVIVLLAGFAGVLIWTWASWQWDLGHAPYHVEKFLLWLILVAGLGVRVWGTESSRDWAHTHAGVERHRIDKAAQVRIAEVQVEADLKRKALAATLKMLEARDNDSDR